MAPRPAPLPSAAVRPRWWGTLLYVPLLYGVGWLAVRPVAALAPQLRGDQLDLLGVAVAFSLLVLSLPWRLRRVWGEPRPWRRLGLAGPAGAALRGWLGGLGQAGLLLAGVVVLLLVLGLARWSGRLGGGEALNALALALGVGFAEELLFRGWLWGELELELGGRRALLLQALLFAAVHPWHQLPGLAAIGLFGGVLLLGLALALQRRADGGRLWGAVGLHGGLVGGWFALQSGLIELTAGLPVGLGGSGGPGAPNPLGGVPGWLGLGLLLLLRRRWW
jgi:membrane protease YdiL (CAAX protease family)